MDKGADSYRRFRENGDDAGLDEIITEYADGLMLYLTGIVGDIHTADEAERWHLSLWQKERSIVRRRSSLCLLFERELILSDERSIYLLDDYGV